MNINEILLENAELECGILYTLMESSGGGDNIAKKVLQKIKELIIRLKNAINRFRFNMTKVNKKIKNLKLDLLKIGKVKSFEYEGILFDLDEYESISKIVEFSELAVDEIRDIIAPEEDEEVAKPDNDNKIDESNSDVDSYVKVINNGVKDKVDNIMSTIYKGEQTLVKYYKSNNVIRKYKISTDDIINNTYSVSDSIANISGGMKKLTIIEKIINKKLKKVERNVDVGPVRDLMSAITKIININFKIIKTMKLSEVKLLNLAIKEARKIDKGNNKQSKGNKKKNKGDKK